MTKTESRSRPISVTETESQPGLMSMFSWGSWGSARYVVPDEPLALEIVDKVPLSRLNGKYCALSYCAGDPTETAAVLVNGLPFNAFRNLEHAIEQALDSWDRRHTGQDLLLWVDQICINQRDPLECASQIAMMREIYRRSDETSLPVYTRLHRLPGLAILDPDERVAYDSHG